MGQPLDEEDAKRLQEGIAKHEQTTKTAEEAARTALETRDAARATVAALHDQEAQLKRIDQQYEEVASSVTRAEGYVSWLTASCCCKCCVQSERVPARKTNTTTNGLDTNKGAPLPQTMKARDGYGKVTEAAPPGKHVRPQAKKLTNIGEGLGGPIESHLQEETAKQDAAIDTIEEVLGDLKVAAQDMQGQLKRQEPLVDSVEDKNDQVKDRIHSVHGQIKRRFG